VALLGSFVQIGFVETIFLDGERWGILGKQFPDSIVKEQAVLAHRRRVGTAFLSVRRRCAFWARAAQRAGEETLMAEGQWGKIIFGGRFLGDWALRGLEVIWNECNRGVAEARRKTRRRGIFFIVG
jgi:hypothetical protein